MNKYNDVVEEQKEKKLLKSFTFNFESISSPLLCKKRFAKIAGVSERVVDGWLYKGHVPSIKIGRHLLVNISLLEKQCLEQSDY